MSAGLPLSTQCLRGIKGLGRASRRAVALRCQARCRVRLAKTKSRAAAPVARVNEATRVVWRHDDSASARGRTARHARSAQSRAQRERGPQGPRIAPPASSAPRRSCGPRAERWRSQRSGCAEHARVVAGVHRGSRGTGRPKDRFGCVLQPEPRRLLERAWGGSRCGRRHAEQLLRFRHLPGCAGAWVGRGPGLGSPRHVRREGERRGHRGARGTRTGSARSPCSPRRGDPVLTRADPRLRPCRRRWRRRLRPRSGWGHGSGASRGPSRPPRPPRGVRRTPRTRSSVPPGRPRPSRRATLP